MKFGLNISESLNIAEEIEIIKLFQICFELSWKILKEILEIHRLNNDNITSLRKIFTIAAFFGIINNVKIGIEILKSRNILAHIYEDEKISEIITKIREKYLFEFENLKKILKVIGLFRLKIKYCEGG